MPKYQKAILLIIFGILIFGYNNCGKVQFSDAPTAAVSTTGCVSSSFGSLCSGTPPVIPPNGGAHGFFYNLTPIPDSNGYKAPSGNYTGIGEAGSMNLLTGQDVIPNLNIYSTELDVLDQSWTQGFPGYPTLQEWFGLCYDGSWSAPSAGSYTFVSTADDALAIWIDGVLIGENDDGTVNQSVVAENTGLPGNHYPVAFMPVNLAAGPHSVELMYYQGWPDALAAQVWVLPVNTNFMAGSTPTDADLMQIASPINGVLNCPH